MIFFFPLPKTFKAGYTFLTLGFPGGSEGKESVFYAGDPGLISGLGRFPWSRKWQPIPVFFLGEFHGQRSLVGCSPRGHKESDMTERLTHTRHNFLAGPLALWHPPGTNPADNRDINTFK